MKEQGKRVDCSDSHGRGQHYCSECDPMASGYIPEGGVWTAEERELSKTVQPGPYVLQSARQTVAALIAALEKAHKDCGHTHCMIGDPEAHSLLDSLK